MSINGISDQYYPTPRHPHLQLYIPQSNGHLSQCGFLLIICLSQLMCYKSFLSKFNEIIRVCYSAHLGHFKHEDSLALNRTMSVQCPFMGRYFHGLLHQKSYSLIDFVRQHQNNSALKGETVQLMNVLQILLPCNYKQMYILAQQLQFPDYDTFKYSNFFFPKNLILIIALSILKLLSVH